jgi:hypothetical protein
MFRRQHVSSIPALWGLLGPGINGKLRPYLDGVMVAQGRFLSKENVPSFTWQQLEAVPHDDFD